MDSLDAQLARRSRRTGWLSLLGAGLVFASIAYSAFTIGRLQIKVEAFHKQIRDLDEQVRARNDEIQERNQEIEALKKDLFNLGMEVEQKKHDIASLNDSLAKLNEARRFAAGLILQILKYLDNDPDLETERAEYRAFANAYLNGRLIPAIDRKLADSADLKKKLRDIVQGLVRPPADGDYHRLEEAVSFEIFGGKARLMRGFGDKIEELRRAMNGEVI